jgi:hypothetical protein
VGVSYYDLRDANPQQPAISTNFWLTVCAAACDAAANWTEVQVAGPFNLQRAAFGNGYFLGDYEGIVGAPSGFELLYALAEPAGIPEFSNAYFVTIPP